MARLGLAFIESGGAQFPNPKCGGSHVGINNFGKQRALFAPEKMHGQDDFPIAAAAQEAFERVLFIDSAALSSGADGPIHRVIVRRHDVVDMDDDAGLQGRQNVDKFVFDIVLHLDDVAGINEKNVAGFEALKLFERNLFNFFYDEVAGQFHVS